MTCQSELVSMAQIACRTVLGPSQNAPGKMQLAQADEPHPIISTDDTLSTSVADATSLTAQLTLLDASGTPVYTGAPIYYSPAGYTPGEAVRFAQQIDAGSLATGAYEWTMTITENYADVNPIVRGYSGFTTVRNLDNSPYGRGWMPAALDSLVIQADGASLADGNGNLFFFLQDGMAGGPPQFITPDALWGRAALSQNDDGSYTLTWTGGGSQQFNSAGQLTSAMDVSGNSIGYTYNPGDGTLASITDATGVTSFLYTAGMLTSVVDFAGRTTNYTYDSSGRLASVTLPDPGHGEAVATKTYAYDPTTGLVASYTDSTGTTSFTYSAWRAVTRITHPNGTYETFSAPLTQALVDTSGGLGGESDPAPLVYVSAIIGSQTDENGHSSQYTVDARGNQLSTTDAVGQDVTTYEHNAEGLVSQMTQPR